jgi:hypothetical protein
MNNIVLDFSANQQFNNLLANQPLAVMPADLAKRLLTNYANRLHTAKFATIMNDHIQVLSNVENMTEAINASLSFVQERELIQNCVNQNWDAYAVPEIVTAL